MCNSQSAPHKCTQGASMKQGEPGSHTSWAGNPEQLCPAQPRVQRPSWQQAYSMRASPYALPYLLFLPLAACFPVLDTEEPVDAVGSIGGEICWADPAGGRHFPWGSPGWPRAPHPHALLVMAEEPPTLGRACAGFTLRLGRQQDDGSEATGFLLGDGEKAGGLLGTLAEELDGYSREKGGFSFCFGRG
ncbi:orexigenic neuropeptide QRFP [Pseudorca crassidens]|uniref:orexigenic neuropeptide QRFP n=1 Tax=Pseudorca crassidens TaxID=82174 RepID=UPI00352EC306